MSEKFQNKFRISSARLKNWDYGWNGMYFVTICTQNRECYFGNVVDRKMELSKIGKIAHQFWNEIPQHFQFVNLGEFVVMPYHVHGIIIIAAAVAKNANRGGKNDKWNPGVLGVIINQYKRICTINARNIYADFGWQSRYYDHIIRNHQSYQNISDYILNNPINWQGDKFYG